jgi:hypothetical protein
MRWVCGKEWRVGRELEVGYELLLVSFGKFAEENHEKPQSRQE